MVVQASLVKIALAGAVGLAGYELWWKPTQARKKTEADLINAAKAKGGSLDAALKSLGKAGCQAYAATNGMPPAASGGLCGALASLGSAALEYGGKYGVKGAEIAGKAIGKESKVVAKDVGKGVKAVGKTVESVASHLKFWGLEGLHC